MFVNKKLLVANKLLILDSEQIVEKTYSTMCNVNFKQIFEAITFEIFIYNY